jgi:hypothetical protein
MWSIWHETRVFDRLTRYTEASGMVPNMGRNANFSLIPLHQYHMPDMPDILNKNSDRSGLNPGLQAKIEGLSGMMGGDIQALIRWSGLYIPPQEAKP